MYYGDIKQTLSMYSTPLMALIRALAPNNLSVSPSLSLPIGGTDTGQVCCQSLEQLLLYITQSVVSIHFQFTLVSVEIITPVVLSGSALRPSPALVLILPLLHRGADAGGAVSRAGGRRGRAGQGLCDVWGV